MPWLSFRCLSRSVVASLLMLLASPAAPCFAACCSWALTTSAKWRRQRGWPAPQERTKMKRCAETAAGGSCRGIDWAAPLTRRWQGCLCSRCLYCVAHVWCAVCNALLFAGTHLLCTTRMHTLASHAAASLTHRVAARPTCRQRRWERLLDWSATPPPHRLSAAPLHECFPME